MDTYIECHLPVTSPLAEVVQIFLKFSGSFLCVHYSSGLRVIGKFAEEEVGLVEDIVNVVDVDDEEQRTEDTYMLNNSELLGIGVDLLTSLFGLFPKFHCFL